MSNKDFIMIDMADVIKKPARKKFAQKKYVKQASSSTESESTSSNSEYSEHSDLDTVVVYTDGSCLNNGKKNAVGGIGIHFPNQELKDLSKVFSLENCTSQRTELYAILTAIRYINSKFDLKNLNIKIKSDSKYSVNCINKWIKNWIKNNWTKQDGGSVLNRDLIEPIYKYFLKYNINIKHVKGHDDTSKTPDAIGNGVADKLANNAMRLATKKQSYASYKKSISDPVITAKLNPKTKPKSKSGSKSKKKSSNYSYFSNPDKLVIELMK